ncbi:MAG TPA: TraR/DksA family transcriptional regulator [Candidatus Omnitrophota bacterium]|nr:TraR/DksA family transcriptional regulator [Candidatus Omnitrophota bacterium]
MPAKKKSKKPAKIVKAVKKTAVKVARPVVKKKPQPAAPVISPSKVKTTLSKKELAEFKELLFDMRAKIVGDLQHLESDSLKKSTEEMTGDHADIIDTAQDEFEREFVLNLAANEQQILNKIDVALHKIGDGTYGMCEKYGTPIPKKRLLALPYTTMSIKAQEEQEKGL